MDQVMVFPGLFLLDYGPSLTCRSSEPSGVDTWDCSALDFNFVRNIRYGLFRLRLQKESATPETILPFLSNYSERFIESQLRLCVSSGLIVQSLESCHEETTVVYHDCMLRFGKLKRTFKVDSLETAEQAIRLALDEMGQPLTLCEVGFYVKWTFVVNMDNAAFSKAFVRKILQKLSEEQLVFALKDEEDQEPDEERFCTFELKLKQPRTPEKKAFNVRDFLDQKTFVFHNDSVENEKEEEHETEEEPPLPSPAFFLQPPKFPGFNLNTSPVKPKSSTSSPKENTKSPKNVLSTDQESSPQKEMPRTSPEAFVFSVRAVETGPKDSTVKPKDAQTKEKTDDKNRTKEPRTIEKNVKKRSSQSTEKVAPIKKRSKKPKEVAQAASVPDEVFEPVHAKSGPSFRRAKLDVLD